MSGNRWAIAGRLRAIVAGFTCFMAFSSACAGGDESGPPHRTQTSNPPPAADSANSNNSLPAGALARFRPPEQSATAAPSRVFAVSADGNLVAWESRGRLNVYVWNTATGKEWCRIHGFDSPVTAIGFSPDGNIVATGTPKGTVQLWDVKQSHDRGSPVPATLKKFPHAPGPVMAIAFSPVGDHLAAGGYWNCTVHEWDIATAAERRRWSGGGGIVWSVRYSPGGNLLAAAGEPRDVELWDTSSGNSSGRLFGHQGGVLDVVFSGSGRLLASTSNDGTVRFWKPRSGTEVFRIDVPKACFLSASFAADERTVATAELLTGEICLWEMLTGKPRLRFHVGRETLIQAQFLPHSDRLASAQNDGSVIIWDATGRKGRPDRHAPRFLSRSACQQLWTDLRGVDAERAYEAIQQLAERPREALPFLQLRLSPVTAADAKPLQRLIDQLDDGNFKRRQQAREDLQRLGETAEPALRAASQRPSSAEVRADLERLLQRIEELRRHPRGKDLAQRRVVEALERMGTDDARALLQKLAGGLPTSPLTIESAAAYTRLSAQPHSREPYSSP